MNQNPDRPKVHVSESQRIINEARIETVYAALTTVLTPFDEITAKLGAVDTFSEEGSPPITRAEVMIALHALVKMDKARRERSVVSDKAEYARVEES